MHFQVIAEKVGTVPTCSSCEVELNSAEDWNVVVSFIMKEIPGNLRQTYTPVH